MSHAEIQVPRVKLGNQGLEVSRLGFGCAGLTGGYSDPLSDEEGISVIKHAFSKGITFFDTADVYGANANEIMIGKALRQLPRDKIQLATKFGLLKVEADGMEVCGCPEYVRSCCEASLKRLGVDYIDLYYQHRIDKLVPIEDTMEELKKLVEEGKIKYIGLSEASPDTIQRAHVVHPITALQMEWSLWTRDIEEEIVPLCRELGIGMVAYSPLGHGFFGGRTAIESGPAVGLMSTHPRFTGENLDKNKVLYERVVKLASKYGCTSAQLSLSWLLHQGDDVIPIPGTTKIKHVDDNVGSLKVKLTAEDLKEITDAVAINEVAGARIHAGIELYSWRFVSKLGFWCVGLIGAYSDPLSDEEGISVIKHAFSKGITFFDTANIYGANANEIMIGKALRQLPRDKIQLATKFGLLKMEADGMEVCGRPEYHRIDKLVPIEDTMEELKNLVEEGKIKYIGLSEASPDTTRRAHAVHPITALQMEWSLWTRDIEEEIVPLCRELGIGIVAYSPLGRGFFGGRTAIESVPAVGLMSTHPRFTGENLDKNKALYEQVVKLASKYGCTSAQLALSWLLHQGDNVIPIPGTTKVKHVDDNVGSLKVKLTAEDLKEITDVVAINEMAGARIHAGIELSSWRFINTPSKSDNASEQDS
ncbi:putative aldo-keto reductase 1 [Quercus suber]|uniref:Aldo-keto reductase 1 n=1 Tax=Quercus suber TaxID=58331 RepID=A0AAW0LIN0_QUESU